MNKYKKFIKEAYNGKLGLTMCQDWKQKIEIEFPELLPKPKQELNKWFKDDSPAKKKWLMFYTDDNRCYGFDAKGDWYDKASNNNPYIDKNNRLATEEEVKEALFKEAEKRGFKKGVKIKYQDRIGIINGDIYWAEGEKIIASPTDYACYNRFFPLMKNGKWAEIIQNTISKAEAEKQLNAKIID